MPLESSSTADGPPPPQANLSPTSPEAGREVEHGSYTEIQYRQFHPTNGLRRARRLVGAFTWILIWPLAMLSRYSNTLFITCSELLSTVPYLFGVIMRAEFYRFALRSCGENIIIEFGTIFLDRNVVLGSNVLIGRYNTIHHCDFGDYVLTAEGCAFLSGSRYHRFDRLDIPMALQGGEKTRIAVADDCWIGAHCVVMTDLGRGAIVGAGSVVVSPVEPETIVAGNPARLIRHRREVVKP